MEQYLHMKQIKELVIDKASNVEENIDEINVCKYKDIFFIQVIKKYENT